VTDEEPTERRRARRFQLRVPVTVLGATDQPASRDLSEGGVFIETAVPQPIGVVLPVRLVHPDTGEVIPAVCQVVRQVHDDDGQLLGLGLRFANTDESLGDRIRNLINDLVESEPGGAGAGAPRDDDELDELDELDEKDDPTAALAVVEFDEPEITWESEGEGDETVEVLVVEAEVSDSAEHHPAAAPIIWPDTQPEKILGALRHGLTPMQLRLLPFINGNNTVEEVAHGAGLGLEATLGDLSDMARRAVIRIPTQPIDDDLAGWEKSTEEPTEAKHAKPLFPGRQEHAAEQERWRQARSLVTQGLAAERNDDFEDAVTLLEQALDLKPPNGANIHARLAILGMEHLGDLDLAEEHARAARDADPHRPYGRRLLRRVKRLRVRGVKPRAKKKPKQVRRTTQQKKKPQTPARVPRRAVATLMMMFLVAGLIGWNAYRYLLPMLDAPPHLDVRELAEIIPATDARIRDGKLVVTTSETWDSLTTMEKTDHLERLAAWARQTHGVSEVLVADSTPVLRARVRGKKITIFGH